MSLFAESEEHRLSRSLDIKAERISRKLNELWNDQRIQEAHFRWEIQTYFAQASTAINHILAILEREGR